MIDDITSDPIAITRLCAPVEMNCAATCIEYKNAEQAAEMSNPHAPFAPSLSCTTHAVEGKNMSGVTVPTMMVSMSVGASPRCARAFRAASVARSLVATPLSTICRSRIPTRVMIHSLLVSTILSRSALVKRRGGTYVPRALILARIGFVNENPCDDSNYCEGLRKESLTKARFQPVSSFGANGRVGIES